MKKLLQDHFSEIRTRVETLPKLVLKITEYYKNCKKS